jgi:hypothetical protein
MLTRVSLFVHDLAASPIVRGAALALARVESSFSWDSVAARTEQVHQSAIDRVDVSVSPVYAPA